MNDNTALVTDAAKDAAQRTLDDYANGVAAHLSGDWGGHNQARAYQDFFNEPVTTHQVSNHIIRMSLTLAGTDRVVKIPALATTATPDPGGAPLIITQPTNKTVYVGGTATFSVAASASIAITYQWRKNGTNITGKTSSSLTLTNCQTTDQAAYSVVVSTTTGSITSNDATLTVLPVPTGGTSEDDGGGGGGGCFKAGTLITRANGFAVPIEQVTVGMSLKSAVLEGLDPGIELAWATWRATQLKARPASTQVVGVRQDSYDHYYVVNGNLEVTYEHPLLVKRAGVWQWQRVRDIVVGDQLYRNDLPVVVRTKLRVNKVIPTYNIDVEPYDVYWANGYLVHNIVYKT